MTTIPLTQGKIALVDDEDAERVLRYSWSAYQKRDKQTWYAHRGTMRGGVQRTILLHREIMNAPRGVQVDHKNGDGLDCQKHNLRIATNSQNHQNMRVRTKNKHTSQFKGVHLHRKRNHWIARVHLNGKDHWLGRFPTPEDAARAYDDKARELHGEFGRYNFPRPGEQSALRD